MNQGQKFTTHGPGKELFTTVVNSELAGATGLEFEGSGGDSRNPRTARNPELGPDIGAYRQIVAGGPYKNYPINPSGTQRTGTDERFGDWKPRESPERQAADSFRAPLVRLGKGEYTKDIHNHDAERLLWWPWLIVCVIGAAVILAGMFI